MGFSIFYSDVYNSLVNVAVRQRCDYCQNNKRYEENYLECGTTISFTRRLVPHKFSCVGVSSCLGFTCHKISRNRRETVAKSIFGNYLSFVNLAVSHGYRGSVKLVDQTY